jgi:hypothetical protein
LGAVTLLSANSGQGPSSVELDSNALDSPVIQKQVEALLHQMTLDEKVGQLVQYSAGQPTGPGTGRTDYDDMIQRGEVGALFNITTAHQVNAYQHIVVGRSRLHIPLLFGLDVIHGFRGIPDSIRAGDELESRARGASCPRCRGGSFETSRELASKRRSRTALLRRIEYRAPSRGRS